MLMKQKEQHQNMAIDVQSLVVNALASYAGNKLAGEVIGPESEQAAILGSVGSAFGTAIATGQILTQTAVGSTFKALAAAGGLVVRLVLRSVHSSALLWVRLLVMLLAMYARRAWAKISYDYDNNHYVIGDSWAINGGDEQTAITMAQSGFNGILDATGKVSSWRTDG